MISISVKTNNNRRTVTTDITSTPKSVFADLGIDVSTSMINLDGVPMTGSDMAKTFEALGVQDGTTVGLTAIVKADGANN